MAITIGWGQADKSYILVEFSAKWEWREFYHTVKQLHFLLDSITQTIPIIVDFSGTKHLPRGVLTHFPAVIQYDHPNRGQIYFVGTNTVLRAIGRMVARMIPKATATASVLPTRTLAIQLIMQSQAR